MNRALVFTAGALIFLSSCSLNTKRHQVQIQKTAPGLPLPTKDDVLMVDGKSMSLTAYADLRTKMKSASSEEVLWVAEALLLLQNEAGAQGLNLNPEDAIGVARYAAEEKPLALSTSALRSRYGASIPAAYEVKAHIDILRSSAVVHRNLPLLAEIR